MQTKFRFGTVAIAGTFDRLHKGHRFFISQAFKAGEQVIIGLTSDEYAREKCQIKSKIPASPAGRQISNYQTRKKELEEFLARKKLLSRTEIVKIDDLYGPAIGKNDIEALMVTNETLEGAKKVNKRRKEKGLKILKILKAPMILAEDKKRIASTRIRIGEIDRYGRLFGKMISYGKISEELRLELKKPIGELIKGDTDNLQKVANELKKHVRRIQPIMVSTVGDEVTKLCKRIDIEPNLAIIDYKVNRKKKYYSLSDLGFPKTYVRGTLTNVVRTVRNPPGNITKTLVKAISQTIKKYIQNNQNQIIRVLGEEDLAGVPAILLSPLGSIVLYGQPPFVPNSSGLQRGKPESGVVVVEVTEKKKQILRQLLDNY